MGIWLAVLGVGAGFTAAGRDDEFGGSYLMAVMLVLGLAVAAAITRLPFAGRPERLERGQSVVARDGPSSERR
ncbi:hypothetical protein ACFQ7F_05655 [Streptomyces sp. NPDC056486]|uniref:hypothetical protein n=1 Tax=Streptomyces sp. NPDC056486 TaxID=3345835 RepID=UPI0036BE49AD